VTGGSRRATGTSRLATNRFRVGGKLRKLRVSSIEVSAASHALAQARREGEGQSTFAGCHVVVQSNRTTTDCHEVVLLGLGHVYDLRLAAECSGQFAPSSIACFTALELPTAKCAGPR
jgi:hypothetical protein